MSWTVWSRAIISVHIFSNRIKMESKITPESPKKPNISGGNIHQKGGKY